MVEGDNGASANTWDAITAEMERLASNGQRNSSEDFAYHRACKILEQIRLQSASESTDASKSIVCLRAELAMERKRQEIMQERINGAKSQAKVAEETRTKLEEELAEVSRQVPQSSPDSPGKQAAADRTADLKAQIEAAEVEAKQVEDETRMMAVERRRIEQMIAEAEARQPAGSISMLGQDRMKAELLQIAHRASDNARTLQEAMAEVSSKSQQTAAARDAGASSNTSATAAFLNSDHGRGLPQSKIELSRNLFHSSGGLQYLANRGQENLGARSPVSPTSPASQSYPARREKSENFDDIQERLNALMGQFSNMASQRQKHNGSPKPPVLKN